MWRYVRRSLAQQWQSGDADPIFDKCRGPNWMSLYVWLLADLECSGAYIRVWFANDVFSHAVQSRCLHLTLSAQPTGQVNMCLGVAVGRTGCRDVAYNYFSDAARQ